MTDRMSRVDRAIACKLIETREAVWNVITILAAREGLLPLTEEQHARIFETLHKFASECADDYESAREDCPHCGS